MLVLLTVVTIVFAILWYFILHSVNESTQRFLCRRQWLFLLIHLPVMWILSTFLGEGMIVGVGSMAGGLIGQIYLALHGMRKFGLTFLGKKTKRYDVLYPPRNKAPRGVSRKRQLDLAVSNKFLEYATWRAGRTPIK